MAKMKDPVAVPTRVYDLSGLLIDLRNSSFLVHNVASDERGTYVWLEDGEEKDPAPIVQSWAGKIPPPIHDQQAWEDRRDQLVKGDKKAAQARAAVQAGQAPKRPSLFSKVFRKLW